MVSTLTLRGGWRSTLGGTVGTLKGARWPLLMPPVLRALGDGDDDPVG